MIREAPRRIEELIGWGTRFDKAEGRLALGREGGHGHDRIVHAFGDATGREIMRAVTERVMPLRAIILAVSKAAQPAKRVRPRSEVMPCI